jgi:putative redox protein
MGENEPVMRQTTVTATWTGPELEYLGTDSKGNMVPMGGDNPSPAQLLLLGLAGCMGMDVAHVLRKKRLQFEAINVTIVGHQPDDYPRPFQTIEIIFHVSGSALSTEAVAKAIALSKDKYCVVGQSLQNPVILETSFEIIQLAA